MPRRKWSSGHHDGGRDQDLPVTIRRQERERTKDVEVSLDPAPPEVDQQRTHQHLARWRSHAGSGFPGRIRAKVTGRLAIAPPRITACPDVDMETQPFSPSQAYGEINMAIA